VPFDARKSISIAVARETFGQGRQHRSVCGPSAMALGARSVASGISAE
jgi:hypothetical protein